MRLFLLIVSLCFFSAVVHPQGLLSNPGFVAALNPPQAPPAPGFYPTNVANTLAFWNYRHTPNGTTLSWTDEVSQIVLTNWAPTYTKPTNTALGWWFPFPSGMTNKPFTTDRNFSMWMVFATVGQGQSYLIASNSASGQNIQVTSSGLVDGQWAGVDHTVSTYHIGSTLTGKSGQTTNAPLWADLVDSQGSLYTNGITTGSSISQPAADVAWSLFGNNPGDTESFHGYVKYLLISTNHAITATEALNLWTWEQTNGVTNVTSGLVAWWKLADATNSTTILDSSGNGWTGILKGSPRPGFTNGLNSVVSQGIAFDGSQNYVDIPVTGSFLPGPDVSVSMWLNFTLSTNAAFWHRPAQSRQATEMSVFSVTANTPAMAADRSVEQSAMRLGMIFWRVEIRGLVTGSGTIL